ncbi:hypothetical protein [Microbulbifer variabilis]|jgi:truncated hemoglobin YjbI|uniref:Uncharacterized protein n=1 Tax=Microbulbifer variabilis TaxID=266805 RepID=A0ABY4VFM3_9GAMM|nr:hypothetical protein [Microbulbifer variabilis]USD23009.1 hypothetical protein MJO52_07725 [Microbulbifer variabilis]
MNSLLEQVGGAKFVCHTVNEFYETIGRHLSSYETCDHRKQQSRQAQFLNHAFSEQPEPDRSSRASFLARGLNPALFDALLEYLEARLEELGFPWQLSTSLIQTASSLYGGCEQDLSIAC